MNNPEVIIIGAGASGLMAARELMMKQPEKVLILEARDRLGGRTFTGHDPLFPKPVEYGAEFIHGNMPVTLGLLKEAGISYTAIEGETWHPENGHLEKQDEFIENRSLMMSTLNELKEDMSIDTFLTRYFGDEKYADMVRSVKRFAEGYDAADTTKASAFALREEWNKENDEDQYRVEGGYVKLIDFLAASFTESGGEIVLSAIVKQIRWQKNNVEVITAANEKYTCKKIVITVPLGILQADASGIGSIVFLPALPGIQAAAEKMGYGSVIKILLQFSDSFWNNNSFNPGSSGNIGFILSGAVVPTYWTQLPDKNPLLTGWLAGPRSLPFRSSEQEVVLEQTLQSLSGVFNTSISSLKDQLVSWKVVNWLADPFALGAYAYATVDSREARKILTEPVEETLFFAGEALYDGPEMGTVEAALASGKLVAAEVIKRLG